MTHTKHQTECINAQGSKSHFFPNAIIYIPIINHSHLLSPDRKRNLKVINGYITTHGPFLLEIPHDEFHTTDLIH